MRRWLIIAVALGACGKSATREVPAVARSQDAGAAAAGEDEATDQSLIATLDEQETKDIEALHALPCTRPVLRGTPLPGPATDDVVALLETLPPELDACLARVRQLNADPAHPVWPVCATGSSHATSRYCTDRPLTDAVRPVVAALVADCGDRLAAAVSRAVGHEDGCTPFVAGRALAKSENYLVLARLQGLAAVAQAAAGHPALALQRLADFVQLGADAYRGGGDLVMAAVGMTAMEMAAQAARTVLRSPALTPADLDTAAAELDRALARLPPMQDIFLGDPVSQIALDLQPVAHGGQGAPDGAGTPAVALVTWQGVLKVRAMLTGACQRDLSFAECLGTLEPFAEKAPAPPGEAIAGMARVAIVQVVKTVRELVRKHALVDELAIEIAVRRLVGDAKRCPTADDFATGPLAERLAPADLGMHLTANDEGGGVWRFDGPRSLTEHNGTTPFTLGKIACKDGALVAPPAP